MAASAVAVPTRAGHRPHERGRERSAFPSHHHHPAFLISKDATSYHIRRANRRYPMTPHETPNPTTHPQNPTKTTHSETPRTQTKQHLAIPQTDH